MLCKNCLKQVEPEYREFGIHVGRYCPECGKWDKWIDKEMVEKLEKEGVVIKKDPESKPLF